MLPVIIGALAVGAIVRMGIDKVQDMSNSIREDGLSNTAKKETQRLSNYVVKECQSKSEQIEKKNDL